MALCMEAFTDTLAVVCNGFMYGSINRHFYPIVCNGFYVWKQITDTLPIVCNGFYVWKHLQTLYQ